jgi:flagellar basal body-associated protein FliL
MQPVNNQKGLTAISIMVLLVVIAFVVLIFLKIMPIYMDGFKVGDVVSSMKEERSLGDKTNREIQTMILKRLDVNMVSDVKAEDIYIKKIKDTVNIDVEYEVRKNLFGNLDIIVSFKKSVEAPAI